MTSLQNMVRKLGWPDVSVNRETTNIFLNSQNNSFLSYVSCSIITLISLAIVSPITTQLYNSENAMTLSIFRYLNRTHVYFVYIENCLAGKRKSCPVIIRTSKIFQKRKTSSCCCAVPNSEKAHASQTFSSSLFICLLILLPSSVPVG